MANPFAAAARRQGGVHGTFYGASRNRLFHDWGPAAFHPDRETQWVLRELRARARDLVRNNPYATGIAESFADNVIGWDEGIRLRPLVTDKDDNLIRPVNRTIARAWKDWGRCECASADGVDSWLELQRLILKTWCTDGEVFIRTRKGHPNEYRYAIELIDADLLDEGFNRRRDKGVNKIVQGVEVDRHGRRVAFHFWEEHPSERGGMRDRKRIPAEQIIHFFVRYRIGQTRGFSLFAPALTTIKMIDGLTESELVASRMAAAKMGFITNNEPQAIEAYAERIRIQNEGDEENESPDRITDISPGVVEELEPGQGFEGFDPTHPNTAFEAFLNVMLGGVAKAFSMSRLSVTGDVSDANYSSMRAGVIPERDHWLILQDVVSDKIHRRIYRDWIGMALLTGLLDLPTSNPLDYREHAWRGRGWKWVDPLKDLLSGELAIALGVNSRSRIAAEQGRDFERVLDELADEQEYAGQLGVDVSGLKRPDALDDDDSASSNNGNGQARALSRLRTLLMEESQNGKN